MLEDKEYRCHTEEEKELSKCPQCNSELIYESSYDNIDLYMYCKSCNYAGVVYNVYKDNSNEEY